MSYTELYVVTGVSGRTGSVVAGALLNAGKRVRVVVRDRSKGDLWITRGAEVVIADFTDTEALTNALTGATGAYIVSPPQYSHNKLFEQAESIAKSIAKAARKSQIPKLVVLSSVGAEQPSGTGWIGMNHMLEKYLAPIGIPVTFLRAAYFMENWTPLINSAAIQNELQSFLAPLNKELPMIATGDIGNIAAEVLCEDWNEIRIIELEGPVAYSPNDVAKNASQSLGKAIKPILIPESNWQDSMSGQGFSPKAIAGFIEMTQALNSEHISFSHKLNIEHRRGVITLDNVINSMNI